MNITVFQFIEEIEDQILQYDSNSSATIDSSVDIVRIFNFSNDRAVLQLWGLNEATESKKLRGLIEIESVDKKSEKKTFKYRQTCLRSKQCTTRMVTPKGKEDLSDQCKLLVGNLFVPVSDATSNSE